MKRRLLDAYDHMTMPDSCAQRIEQRMKRRLRSQHIRNQTRRVAPQKAGRSRIPAAAAIAFVFLLAGIGGALLLRPEPAKEAAAIRQETTQAPVMEQVVSTATILSTGDILMHKPVINAGRAGEGYDFSPMFAYISQKVSAADYAVANLETTLAGSDSGYEYSGYPNFNCPDQIVDSAKNAGFDLLLNANNHSYDTGSLGAHRTIQVIREKGLDSLGFVSGEEEKNYLVKQINGIHIGMICYTYETNPDPAAVALNGTPLRAEDAALVNTFHYEDLETFYGKLAGQLEDMRADGAEATILYIHWGDEYQLTPNGIQTQMAQRFCDMGIDVIIGGHPHVVQPMALLQSGEDPDHRTVCLYSMGNAVSNQRKGSLTAIETAHTEDAVLFSVAFCKYSDGTVYLEDVELLPVWVYRRSTATENEYNMLPLNLEEEGKWQEMFGIGPQNAAYAKDSYSRTMSIVGEGLSACRNWLRQEQQARDLYYRELAFGSGATQTEE